MNNRKFHKIISSKKIGLSIIFFIIFISIIITIYGMRYYNNITFQSDLFQDDDNQDYSKHFALILEDADSPFSESIYEGGKAQGEKQNIYIENFGKNLPFSYTVEERLEMAISSGVDGIIIEGNSNEDMGELINHAIELEIPVVTIIDDVPISNRICFVGVNRFQLGKNYGNQILKAADGDTKRVIVLLDTNANDKSSDIIFTGIKDVLKSSNIEVVGTTMNRKSAFSSEETIHDIIMDEENEPDIIVCLNSADTISAYQTIVDYNKVGRINIIGYYNSEIIQSAINKNIIHSSIAIDTKQMGEYSVKSLNEYLTSKFVSEYMSVDMDIVE